MKHEIKKGDIVEVKGFKGQLFVIEEELCPGIFSATTTLLKEDIKELRFTQRKNKKSERESK